MSVQIEKGRQICLFVVILMSLVSLS